MRAIVFTLLTIALSGCGMFRKVFKSSEHSKLEIRSESKKDSAGLIIDRSTITEKTKVDTLIAVPGKIVKQDVTFNMDSLVNGLTAVKNELIDVKLILNPVTGILSTQAYLKPVVIPFRYDHEKVTQNDITQRSEQSESKKDLVKKDRGKTTVEKQPINIWFYIFGVAVFALAIGSIMFWIKRKNYQ